MGITLLHFWFMFESDEVYTGKVFLQRLKASPVSTLVSVHVQTSDLVIISQY